LGKNKSLFESILVSNERLRLDYLNHYSKCIFDIWFWIIMNRSHILFNSIKDLTPPLFFLQLLLVLLFKVILISLIECLLSSLSSLFWLNYSQSNVVQENLVVVDQSNNVLHEIRLLLTFQFNLNLLTVFIQFLLLNLLQLLTQYLEHDFNEDGH
jgi:hypothetical protein